MRLMTPADVERLPEVGVFVEDEPPAVPLIKLVGPLIGKNGLPAKACIYDNTRVQWIREDGLNVRIGRPPPTCLPPTYQVRPYF